MMKKKTWILRCGKLLCLTLCVLLLSGLAFGLCRHYDYNVTKLAGFYAEPEDSLDVVLLGASEVFTGFSSAYAYELYGYTSYPYAQDSAASALYESQLKEILKHQNPQWIVVEINGALYDDPAVHTDTGGLRRYLDNIPFSRNKVETILRNVPSEDWYFYFFPLAKTHSNWRAACEQGEQLKDYWNIRLKGSLLKGNVITVNDFEAPENRDVTEDFSTAPLEPESETHLRSLLEYCRDQKIENVLFVRFPHIIAGDRNYERFQRGNRAEQIVREYGYPFVNMEREYRDIGLDFGSDFYNDDHLNLSGQKKLTEYFGRMLAEEYGVGPSQLPENIRQNWDLSAKYGRALYDVCEEYASAGQFGYFYEDGQMLEILSGRIQNG